MRKVSRGSLSYLGFYIAAPGWTQSPMRALSQAKCGITVIMPRVVTAKKSLPIFCEHDRKCQNVMESVLVQRRAGMTLFLE